MYEADDEKICSSPEYKNRPEAAAAATADPGDVATSGEHPNAAAATAGPKDAARRRTNDPKTQNMRATVTMCIHQEVLNSQLVHRPQREQLRRLPRPSRGDPSARLNARLPSHSLETTLLPVVNWMS